MSCTACKQDLPIDVAMCATCAKATAFLATDSERLQIRLAWLQRLVDEREDAARAALVLVGQERQVALETLAEGLIIDGADACEDYGPCPTCVAKNGSLSESEAKDG